MVVAVWHTLVNASCWTTEIVLLLTTGFERLLSVTLPAMKFTYLTMASLAAVLTCVGVSTRSVGQPVFVFRAEQGLALGCLFSCWVAIRRAKVAAYMVMASSLLYQGVKFLGHYEPRMHGRGIEGALVGMLLCAAAREDEDDK